MRHRHAYIHELTRFGVSPVQRTVEDCLGALPVNLSWVVNASPLILLAKVGSVDLLLGLTGKLVIPASVAAETQAGPSGDPARQWLHGAGAQWVKSRPSISATSQNVAHRSMTSTGTPFSSTTIFSGIAFMAPRYCSSPPAATAMPDDSGRLLPATGRC
jgi:hypothetical protein